MTEADTHRRELKNTGYEIFIGILSVLSIFNLVLLYTIEDDAPRHRALVHERAPQRHLPGRLHLPAVHRRVEDPLLLPPVRLGRPACQPAVPTGEDPARLPPRPCLRLLRAYGIKNVARSLLQDRAGSALLTLLLMGILVLEFGSLEILHVEQNAPGANITSASDALWYIIVTISTVGYGDRYPVTNEGRIVGSLIIVVGVGIFGTFTGYLANLFLAPSRRRRPPRNHRPATTMRSSTSGSSRR